MKPKFLLIFLLALLFFTGCGNGGVSDSYITKHIVGSWTGFDGDMVLDKASGKVLYEDFDLVDADPSLWTFLNGGTFSCDGIVGTWTVKDGMLVFNFEDFDFEVEPCAVKFKNADEVYFMSNGNVGSLGIEYEASLLRRIEK